MGKIKHVVVVVDGNINRKYSNGEMITSTAGKVGTPKTRQWVDAEFCGHHDIEHVTFLSII